MKTKAMVFLGSDPRGVLEAIRRQGGTVLANYGQSALVRVEEDGVKALEEQGLRVRRIPDTPVVEVGAFSVDTAHETLRPAAAETAPSGRTTLLVRLAGPMHPDWKSRLEQTSAIIYQHLSDDAYLARIDSAKVGDLQALDFVESVTEYHPALKINPTLLSPATEAALAPPKAMTLLPGVAPAPPTAPGGLSVAHRAAPPVRPEEGNLELMLFDEKDQLAAIDAVRAAGATIVDAQGVRLIVSADLALLPKLADIPQVRAVNPYAPRRLHNNVATGIIHADALQNTHGLTGNGQIVAIADSGLDNGHNDATMLADFAGRIAAIYALGRPGDPSDPDGHGTHVAGSVFGNGSNSSGHIRGMAPEARVVHQSVMDASGGLGGIPTDLNANLFSVARGDGARIHTNSWGAPVNGAYNTDCTYADTFAFQNRESLVCFSSGNEGPNRVGSPGSAKNVLTVGASESLRTLPATVHFPSSPRFPTGATASGFNTQADNQNQVASFSSVGPAQNNRRKPDVVAPGTWILSTRSSVSVYDSGPDGIGPHEAGPATGYPNGGTGDETGVPVHADAVGMGLPGQPIFKAGDQNTPAAPAGSGAAATNNYMYLGGTSMATPITAGSCALVRQYLIEQRGHTPSGALIKALMVNGAVDMGMGIPHTGQGWGRVDLTNTLFPPGTDRVQFDDTLENAVATGDIRTFDVFVSAVTAPLVVTLVWRDPAGSTIQNRLHLRVRHAATGTESTSDPIADIRNNVQKVVVNPPQLGLYHIEVEGVSVGAGVPEFAGTAVPLRQDFALAVAGATGFSYNPSDIVQVLDHSGSMGYEGYMDPAKERAKQMVDILQINDKAGLVIFNHAPSTVFPLTTVDSQSVKDSIHTLIDPVSSTGMTDLRKALQEGVDDLGTDTGRPRAIVFLSDGKHTTATPVIDNPFLDSIAAANVNVYTIALGPDSDFTALNNISSRTGTGAVFTVESAADLHKLHEIYYTILGASGVGSPTHLESAPVDLEKGLTQTAAIAAGSREAHFALSWQTPGSLFDFSIQDPSGKAYTSASNEVFHFAGSTHQFFRVHRPKAGLWKLIVKAKQAAQGSMVTTAALAASDYRCEVTLDPKYLFHGRVLISLKATLRGKPLTGATCTADVIFPTRTFSELLRKYAKQLAAIEVDPKKLVKDKPDPDLFKLGLYAAQCKQQGIDIWERQTVRLKLTDDGKQADPKADDGIYTALFDPAKNGVAGNFQIQVRFATPPSRVAAYNYRTVVPVFVPRLN